MTKKIAVVAAANVGYTNTGMLSVDLAAHSLLKRVAPDCEVNWFTLHPPETTGKIHSSVDPDALPFKHHSLVDKHEFLREHDAIVFWGDFLQARQYFLEDAAHGLKRYRDMDEKESYDLLLKILLLEGAPDEVQEKAIIFGSTILFNRGAAYLDPRYTGALKKLLQNCAGALFGEPISATKAAHLRGDFQAVHLGCDAAFLLQDQDLDFLPTGGWSSELSDGDKIGVFFGARSRPPLGHRDFVRAIATHLGCEVEWFPWFPLHEWLVDPPLEFGLGKLAKLQARVVRRRMDRFSPRGYGYKSGDLFKAIKKYRLIITDTYHLCVNAIRAGTPVICYDTAEKSLLSESIGDFKKKILLEMYDASDFYFDVSSFSDRKKREAAVLNALEALRDPALAYSATARARNHAADVAQRFTAMLTRLLN